MLWRVATFILFLWHPVELFASEKSHEYQGKKAGIAPAPDRLPIITVSELSSVLEVQAYEWLLSEQNSQANTVKIDIIDQDFPESPPFLYLHDHHHQLILSPEEVLLACGMEMETFMLVGLILTSNISSCVINNSLREPRPSGDADRDDHEVIWRPKLAR